MLAFCIICTKYQVIEALRRHQLELEKRIQQLEGIEAERQERQLKDTMKLLHSLPPQPQKKINVTESARRFPAPWIIEEYRGISYIVRDANNFAVAYVYFDAPQHVVFNDVQGQVIW